jgi:hypothetical protein
MKIYAVLILLHTLLLPALCKAEITSTLIKIEANSRNLSTIDAVREFVYKHSDHGDGDWNKTYASNATYVLDHLFRTAIGDKKAERPELLCGERSTAMQAIFDKLSIRTRTIYVFSNYAGTLMGHVFIEVMNPLTGSWEVQDADYNVAYENQKGRRLSIGNIIAEADFKNITPVNATARGWNEAKAMPLMRGQFFNIAYSPTEGMLYYNQQALDTGLVTQVTDYIKKNHGPVNYTPSKIGNYIVRPLADKT